MPDTHSDPDPHDDDSERDERDDSDGDNRDDEPSIPAPFAPDKDDDSPLGDTDQHSDA